MASLKVPVEVIAKMLHRGHLEVTQYYSQRTKQQVIDAPKCCLSDRIDVAAEAVRSPEEIGRMLCEAEGQIERSWRSSEAPALSAICVPQVRLHRDVPAMRPIRDGVLPDRNQAHLGCL